MATPGMGIHSAPKTIAGIAKTMKAAVAKSHHSLQIMVQELAQITQGALQNLRLTSILFLRRPLQVDNNCRTQNKRA